MQVYTNTHRRTSHLPPKVDEFHGFGQIRSTPPPPVTIVSDTHARSNRHQTATATCTNNDHIDNFSQVQIRTMLVIGSLKNGQGNPGSLEKKMGKAKQHVRHTKKSPLLNRKANSIQ